MADVFRFLRSQRQSARRAARGRDRARAGRLVGPGDLCGQEFERQIAAELKIAAAVLWVWTRIQWRPAVRARRARELSAASSSQFALDARRPADRRNRAFIRRLRMMGEDPRSPQVQEVISRARRMIARQGAPQSVTAISGSAPSALSPGPARIAICVCLCQHERRSGAEYFSDGSPRTSSRIEQVRRWR